VASSILFFSLSMVISGLNVALPVIGRGFNVNAVLLTWVTALPTLTTAVLMVPFGRLADIVGLKKISIIGLCIYLPFVILVIFSTSIYMLLVCQFLQAIGMSMIFGTMTAIITAAYPAKERGKALGINVGVLYFGFAVAPFIAGFLTEHLGWWSIFLPAIPGSLIALISFVWKVKGDWVQSRGEKFDYTGSIIFAVALVLLVYGFSIITEPIGWPLLLAGAAGIYFFFRFEARTKAPVFDTGIFKNNKIFLFSNLTVLISYSALTAVGYLLSLYLQYNKGFSASQAGLVLVAQPAIQAVFSPISGRLSDKVEPRVLASIGMGLTCLGLIPFAFLTAGTPMFLVIIALLVLGAGFGLFSSPNTNAIMSSVSPKQLGIASAILSTFRTTGQLFSMAIVMVIITVVVGRVEITPQYYAGFLTCVRLAFGIFAVLCFISIFTSLARGKVKQPVSPDMVRIMQEANSNVEEPR
jgi:MFS family permease